MTLASCVSSAAFAKDYAQWTWRDGVKTAMDYGNFEWDYAAEAHHYDPKGTPKLLTELGASRSSTARQREAGRALALQILSCVRVSSIANPDYGGDGDTLYENMLFGWSPGVYLAQSLKLPADEVRAALIKAEQPLNDVALFAFEAKHNEAAKVVGKTLRAACPDQVTKRAELVVMILADKSGLKPKSSR